MTRFLRIPLEKISNAIVVEVLNESVKEQLLKEGPNEDRKEILEESIQVTPKL